MVYYLPEYDAVSSYIVNQGALGGGKRAWWNHQLTFVSIRSDHCLLNENVMMEHGKQLLHQLGGQATYGSHTKSLLSYLLCCPQRQAFRGNIMDELWGSDLASIDDYMQRATSRLRHLLKDEPYFKLAVNRTKYTLADQSLLWVDADHCKTVLEEAKRIGVATPQGLALLQEAEYYFRRGRFLEEETGLWIHSRRSNIHTISADCVHWLLNAYEAQGQDKQREDLAEYVLRENPMNDDAFCHLMTALHKRGMTSEALRRYRETATLAKQTGTVLSAETQTLARRLQNEPRNGMIPSTMVMTTHTNDQNTIVNPLLNGNTQSILVGEHHTKEPVHMLKSSRRQVLQDILNAACAALVLSPYALLPQDSRERLEWIMSNPSYVDEEALGDLYAITQRYWGLSKNASIDLLSGISGHFATITQLLKESHPTPIYRKLCDLASENALLLGKTFHDIREYDLAWEYYKFSLKIAQETHNTDLWANGVGRIALLLIYWGLPQNGLPLLHQAQKNEIHNQRLRPWLSAIEAEIHAMMGDIDSCQHSLSLSKNINLPTSLADDIYTTGFNPSRLAGYEGACFVRLRKPELALPALKHAFALCDPTSLRRRSTLLADIGTVHAQLGDVKTASALIFQALDMTDQTKSLVVLQRIYKGRGELDHWKDSSEVKDLDERVSRTLTSLTRIKNHV